MLADCLPGNLQFTDVDAATEVNGRFIFVEWKDHRSLCFAQETFLRRLTALSIKVVVIAVEGNAETMEVRGCQRIHNNIVFPCVDCIIIELKQLIKDICSWFGQRMAIGKEGDVSPLPDVVFTDECVIDESDADVIHDIDKPVENDELPKIKISGPFRRKARKQEKTID